MLERLHEVPGASIAKLYTYETDTLALDPAALPVGPELCFIDGEHTHAAALVDARFCRRAAADRAAVVFHDRAVVPGAIADFLDDLAGDGEPFFAYALPSQLFVVELGDAVLFATEPVKRVAGRTRALWCYANRERAERRIRRLLLAESRARRALPGWLRRSLASVADRRAAADACVRSAPAGVAASGGADTRR
jgi:hypothetical protein